MRLRICLFTPMVFSSVSVLFSFGAAGQESVTAAEDGDILRRMGPPFFSGAILPAPKEAEYGDGSVLLADGKTGLVFYQTEYAVPPEAEELLNRLLNTRVEAYKRQFDVKWQDAPHSERVLLSFVLADAATPSNALQRLSRADALTHIEEQGYALEVDPNGIVCAAKDNAGLVNALASFLQLLHVDNGRLVARRASVVDWPAFRIRYTSEYQMLGPGYFDWMMLYKINGFATSYRVLDWAGLAEEHRAALETIGDYIRRYKTMHFMAQLHLTGRAYNGRVMDSCNPEHVEQLFETVRQILELGNASHLWLCYDDVIPELQPREIEQGFKTPGAAHCALLDKLNAFVKSVRPGAVAGFVPTPYQGRHYKWWKEDYEHHAFAVQYMADIHAWPNTDVRIVWTGPVTESRRITIEDIDHYQALIGPGKKLSYWDNTWHYHQPLRNFHARYLDQFVEYCADRTSYINVNCRTPIGKFFSATANDYYWNPEAFDEKRCRQQAVGQFMGPGAVAPAERFYELRGEDYFVFFKKKVDLGRFEQVLDELARASWDAELPQTFWREYSLAAEAQEKPERKR